MLIEISKFLLSRGDYTSDGSGFGFFGVMGPDEFQLMVNQNTYTNFMAKKSFELLLKFKDLLDIKELKKIESIDNCFSEIDYRVYLPIEEGVIPQQEKKLAPLYVD